MSYKEQINMERLPQHVAVIMDGNGRWAQRQGQERIFGHYAGVKSVRATTEAAAEIGLKYLTLYAFSTENWNRPKAEVDGLMELFVETIAGETETLNRNNVRLLTIGQTDRLPQKARQRFEECMKFTEANTGLRLILALSYSARSEITDAVRQIAAEAGKGLVSLESIDENYISRHLCTRGIPDPDLLIRTSGELRISNFLLWQIAYSELYFTPTLWPDFGKEDFYQAIVDYQHRERRYGKTSEQVAQK